MIDIEVSCQWSCDFCYDLPDKLLLKILKLCFWAVVSELFEIMMNLSHVFQKLGNCLVHLAKVLPELSCDSFFVAHLDLDCLSVGIEHCHFVLSFLL